MNKNHITVNCFSGYDNLCRVKDDYTNCDHRQTQSISIIQTNRLTNQDRKKELVCSTQLFHANIIYQSLIHAANALK